MINGKTLYTYKAKVIYVYDGDSVRMDIDLGFKVIMSNQMVRLMDIDAPELRGDEREYGLITRDYLRGLIGGKEVLILSHKDKSGKYGRWLVDIFLSDETIEGGYLHVNKHLVDEGHARIYGE
jgi:micrococcal nuclease